MRYAFLLISFAIYLSITLWANFDLFPEDFMQYWWFDDVAHVVVFGLLTLLALYACRSSARIQFWHVTGGMLTLATTDELLQLVLVHRTFSVLDWVWSVTGIVSASGLWYLWRYLRR